MLFRGLVEVALTGVSPHILNFKLIKGYNLKWELANSNSCYYAKEGRLASSVCKFGESLCSGLGGVDENFNLYIEYKLK